MTEVRDWQKDKEEIDLFMDGWFPGGASNNNEAVKAFFYFAKDALPHYHQQYAAEKERAEKAEQRARATDAMEAAARATGAALIEAEGREKKLREAIKSLIDDGFLMIPDGENGAMDLLSSLYPLDKEGETK